jgi:hypothetical protein
MLDIIFQFRFPSFEEVYYTTDSSKSTGNSRTSTGGFSNST